MADTTHQTLGIKFFQTLQKLAEEQGNQNVAEILDDMILVYHTVCDGLLAEGPERITHLREALYLRNMAVDIASRGNNMGEVSNLEEDEFGIHQTFMPGSLIEIRDEALADAQAKLRRQQNISLAVANNNGSHTANTEI